MRTGRMALVESLLPAYVIEVARDPDSSVQMLNLPEIFDCDVEAIWLEIGFGNGENIVECATKNPQVGIIGCDPFFEGVGKLLSRISAAKLENIRIFPGDVRDLLPALPVPCLAKILVLFPDPWPKKRHHKRRLFQTGFVELLANATIPSAEVVFSTDHGEYARWVLALFLHSSFFTWESKTAEDWRCRPPNIVCTRYENKALRVGRRSMFLKFYRNSVTC
jgi:tRNA (guanine-N7-)-methyltransferase